MKDEKIIKKITIDIAGNEVEVTPKQAKALHEALSDLLGLNKAVTYTPPLVIRERPYWPYPTITWSTGGGSIGSRDANKWDVFCKYDTNTQSVNLAVK